MYRYFIPVVLVLFACHANKKIAAPSTAARAKIIIDSITKTYAPDQRIVLFKVDAYDQVITGETTSGDAKTALVSSLHAAGITFIDSIVVLPQVVPGMKKNAIVVNSVANLRVQPRHQAELSTQATLGTPLTVLKKERGWYFVRTPDKYLAWVDGGAIEWMTDSAFNSWQASKKILYSRPYGFAYSLPDKQSPTVADLVYGDILSIRKISGAFVEAGFPDGRVAYLPSDETVNYQEWMKSGQFTSANLVATANNLLGLPYLWGGTSFKGVDCSGFTRTVYFMNGLLLPRDASQQANVGTLVDTKNGWDNLQPGDLLFFGSASRAGQPARVVHVAMWVGGNKEFIHSSGRVMIGSMEPSAPNYDEGEHRRFLWARRISPADAVVDLRATSLYEN